MFPTSTRTLLLLFLLLSAAVLWAQPADPILQNPFEKVSVTGTLLQESTGEPLAFATVVLYALADSSMAANTLTEVDGKFRLEVTPGSYYLVFSYVGFEEKTIADLQISGEFASVDLEEVYMRADAIALQEVEVRAERSQMELKLDRRVFNVGKDLANAGNSAADILDRVPSVSVDPEGNVSLRGSQSVRILVNGKPSGLLSAGDSEALLRMQGDIIESVEVITNPSARYEAEGEAGIINIILKKNQEKGVNGSFGATVGHPHNYGGSYNLNFRRQDLNFFSNFGVDYRKSPGGGEET
ncbi:MAG: carboxypeptidase regulatory-like domain-containing protein, partial [Saprospiraceae bacterium]|nr:carboxypeptidase regulatory-like domain-containing protein [Saprospiraceae bacterium]